MRQNIPESSDMQTISILLAVGGLFLVLPRVTSAQATNPQAPAASSQNFSPATAASKDSAGNVAPECCPSASDQPTSLGEIARLARAKRASQPKAAKIFDEENMPRSPLRAGDKAPGMGDEGASGGGKVTLLDFWASWCGPCRDSLPGLRQLEAVYRGERFEVVSIDEDEDQAVGQRFAAQNQMNWTQRFDPNHQLMRQFGASALPTYILIGKDGTVVQEYVGHDPNQPVVDRIGPDVKKSLEAAE
jgi:thiol-disulfide isomerase/thioredoxin